MTLDSENHALRKPAKPVNFEVDENGRNPILGWTIDLKEAMDKHQGVGIAGPQIGINYRIALVKVKDGVLTLLNPKIIKKSSPFKSVEGCLSAPGKLVKVQRFKHITIKNHSIFGEEFTYTSFNKETSRRIQHEMDHLDGIMCIDKGKEYDLQSKIRKLSR